MPNWKKVIVSGSDASLNSLFAPSITGSLTGSVSAPGTNTQILYNSASIITAANNFVFSGSSVGIGTSTPTGSVQLDVSGSARFTTAIDVGQLGINGQINMIRATTGQTVGGMRAVPSGTELGGSGFLDSIRSTNGAGIWFSTFNGSGTTERMRITGGSGNTGNILIGTTSETGHRLLVSGSSNSGSVNLDNTLYVSGSRVGIGTSNPTYELHVSSSGSAGGALISGFNPYLRINNIGGPNLFGIEFLVNSTFYGYTGVASAAGAAVIGSQLGDYFLRSQNKNILFSVNAGAGTAAIINSSGSVAIGPNKLTANARLDVSGSAIITGSLTVTQDITGSRMFLSASSNVATGSVLTVYGSGSAQPVFTVQGSQGELFSVTDSLSGSLFSVNDISGLPILEVFSDNTVLVGNYLDPMLITTAKVTQTNSGSFVMYSLPTASYDTAFFEYSVRSGSNARAGTIMAIQSGSAVNFTETTTTDFGTTSAVSFAVVVTGSNMALTGSSTSGAWTIKTIVRGL